MYAMRLFSVVSFALLVRVITAAPSAENGQLDREKVDYFKDKINMKIQEMENEVAKEMVLTKPLVKPVEPTEEPTEEPTKKSCFDDGEADSLNEWSLMHLINSIVPGTFTDSYTSTSNTFYAVINYGRTIEDNSDPLRVLWPSSLGLSSQLPPPAKVLLNFPPYANTSLYFIEKYGESEQKPVIGILGMFGTETLGMAIGQLKCLAKLKFIGFSLVPWEIDEFKTNVNDACNEIIDQAVSSSGFTEELENVEHLIQFVTEMSQNPNIKDWCLTTTTVLAKLQSRMKMHY